MTKMLEDAVLKVSALPPQERDRLAIMLIEDRESEKRWDKRFAQSQGTLELMSEQALAEHRAGRTRPLEDLLNEVDDD